MSYVSIIQAINSLQIAALSRVQHCSVQSHQYQHQQHYDGIIICMQTILWKDRNVTKCREMHVGVWKKITTGGSWGAIRPCPHPVCQWDLSPAVKDFYHTKMAHILVSVYSVFFQLHSTSEPITIINIHIIDSTHIYLYHLLPPLTLHLHLLCLWPIARHLITYSISTKLSEWNKAAKGRTLEAFRQRKPPPSPYFLHCWLSWGYWGNWFQNLITSS